MSSQGEPLLSQPSGSQFFITDEVLTSYFFAGSVPLSPQVIYHLIALALCTTTALLLQEYSNSVLDDIIPNDASWVVHLWQLACLLLSPVAGLSALLAMLFSLGQDWQAALIRQPWKGIPMVLMAMYLVVLGSFPADLSAWRSALVCVGILLPFFARQFHATSRRWNEKAKP